MPISNFVNNVDIDKTQKKKIKCNNILLINLYLFSSSYIVLPVLKFDNFVRRAIRKNVSNLSYTCIKIFECFGKYGYPKKN